MTGTPEALLESLEKAGRPPAFGALCRMAVAWMIGILLARLGAPLGLWITAGLIFFAPAAFMAIRRRWRGATYWSLLALVPIAAAWATLDEHYVHPNDIRRYVGEPAQLARVEGVIDAPPIVNTSRRGAFGQFGYRPPGTMCSLTVERMEIDGAMRRARGRLALKIDVAVESLRQGDRIEMTGWLGAIEGPVNPGEYDFRAAMAAQGIHGRLSAPLRDNLRVIGREGSFSLASLREAFSDEANRSLYVGMPRDSRRMALLEILLLGRKTDALEGLDQSFRRVGLAHILSISGSHLVVMLGLVWALLRLCMFRPDRAAMILMAVLLLYLIAVPPQVPVIRAGIMAGVFLVARMTGRRAGRFELLALACMLALIWRPADLFNAGFQLSFGCVLALMAFTAPLAEQWIPEHFKLMKPGLYTRGWRKAADYVAVNVAAFFAATPLVAVHFGMITPLTVLLSLLALPLITAVLALGYFKIYVGIALPTLGRLLAAPLAWLTDMLALLVDHASNWPASTVELPGRPSVAWAIVAIAAAAAWMLGLFRGRRIALALTAAICVGWLAVPALTLSPPANDDKPARLNMFMVGSGTCHLLRLGDARDSHTLMYDCGSQEYLHIGYASIAPALEKLGVNRIDTLIISHADLDHYSGVLDVADGMPIGRVLLSKQFMDEAAGDPGNAAAHLVSGLAARGIPVELAQQGWRETLGGASCEMLWPPADYRAQRANDVSLVLRVEVAGRRILLNGDVQQDAITTMLSRGVDLAADVCDLPHHGSFVDASPKWLAAVSPGVVLQSCGPARLESDLWRDILEQRSITRWITAHHGMVELSINARGEVDATPFKTLQPFTR